MLKKILIALVLLAMAAVLAASFLVRKAPAIVRDALERSLGRKVTIRDIRYRFPGTFILEGFEVREGDPFAGEISFAAESLSMELSALGLSSKRLLVDRIEVSGADVRVRKRAGRLYHALSSAGRGGPPAGAPEREGQAQEAARGTDPGLSLEIGEFSLSGGRFSFVDYDADPAGFVATVDSLRAKVRRIRVPAAPVRTAYEIEGRLEQGRDFLPAELAARGWTRFSDLETDASFDLRGLYLPYFRPYYAQVTPAVILEGSLDAHTLLRVDERRLSGNADLVITGLHFDAYEEGEELFGMKADEVLSFLKDSAGRLKFPIAFEWELGAPSRDALRRSVAKSLQRTVLGNAGNILTEALRRYGELEGEESPLPPEKRDKIKEAVDKVKDILGR